MGQIEGTWNEILKEEYKKPYYKTLYEKVKESYATTVVYPPSDLIFQAFHLTPYEKVKVVILGQDPYHEKGQAEGLAFSVRDGMKLPPSLQNIFKEIRSDIGKVSHETGSLRHWSEQGVLLLNTCLTVEAHKAFSHSKFGWQEFTDAVLKKLNEKDSPIVFILWGNPAIAKKIYLTNPKHLVITSPHPSPFSASKGFFGSRPFSRTNEFLVQNHEKPIIW